MPEGLDSALAIVRSRPFHWWTAEQVQSQSEHGASFGTTAFNNRLNKLVEMGHLERHREGRQIVYTITKPKRKGEKK